ncbi:MAG: ATP-dependent DNA helicase RecG [Gammaproteobacteria bacterium]|nr:ATP-dependent DNA helicase RecG [Gammaproteobacteria bacterium]
MNSSKLNSPVIRLSGVGPALEKKLNRIGIYTIQDLLFHLPYRYIDRTKIIPIGSLVPGVDAYIQGKIELCQITYGRRRSLLCAVSDGTGSIILRFFHFSRYQQTQLENSSFIRCWSQVRRGPKGMEMVHPEYQLVSDQGLSDLEQTLTPVYPLADGLTQKRLRKLTEQALAILKLKSQHLEELVPAELQLDRTTPTLIDAITYLHRPPADADIDLLVSGTHPAQKRLIFEELLTYQISLFTLRKRIRQYHARSLKNKGIKLSQQFCSSLPFDLTSAQQRVINEINSDLDTTVPMLRLVQGDVGSGKTVVAGLAAVRAVAAGLQVAFMAPTELLAEQHFINLKLLMADLGIKLLLLTGKANKTKRDEVNKLIASGKSLLIIGTHALFQTGVTFSNLGLVIIDEQHRFGVEQRLALIEKGSSGEFKPHQLIMTATPIPRTLAMSIFAELDVSTIDELPPGRQPVNTVVLNNEKRNEIIERIDNVCRQGRQVYWVCTLIEDSDSIQSQAAVKTYDSLQQSLPELTIELIHGRLKSPEKEDIMKGFKAGRINLLVATTVIEVGVDVANATLMIIENSERLGLSQLHQLRGRVGRGADKSVCVLLYQSPLSENARSRLEIMRTQSDGFIIAEKDLELRGPGDMLGTRQTGLPQLKIASLVRDAKYLPKLQKIAEQFIESKPEKVAKLQHRWLSIQSEYVKV